MNCDLTMDMEKKREMEIKRPHVSVIIPIYNTKPYLESCIQSASEQTLQNIEIICVNDGSTDGSEEIVKEYAKKDQRIKLISRENGGLSAARNTGLQYATGEYCYFFDSDDIIEHTALERLYKQAKQDELDILFFGGEPFFEQETPEVLQVYEKEKVIWERKRETGVLSGEELFSDFQLDRIFMSSVVIQLIRRQYMLDNELIFAEGFIHEDLIFTFESTLRARRVKCVKDCLFKRRLRADSIVTSKLSYRNFEGRFNNFIQSIYVSQKYEGNNQKVKAAIADFIKMSFNNTLYVYKKLEDEERKKIFSNESSNYIYAAAFQLLRYDLRL